MKTVAITGRSGCGKSSVNAVLSQCGYVVFDGDECSRQMLKPGSSCLPRLAARFGQDILDENGCLKRRLLADRAFATPEGTKDLTDITQPEILRRMRAAREQAKQKGHELFFIDGAAIVGTAFEPECDVFVLVCVSREVSIARICARDGITPEMAARRLDAQPPEDALRQRADYILQNDSDLPALRQAVLDLIQQLKASGKVENR